MSDLVLTEEDQELISRYKERKNCLVALARVDRPQELFGSFTVEEILRLSKLINEDMKFNEQR